MDFVLKALYLTGTSKQCFVLKAAAFLIADICSHRQLKGNFAVSGCLMDLCKQTKRGLAGSEEAFWLEEDTQKSNAIADWGEEGVELFVRLPSPRNPRTAQIRA